MTILALILSTAVQAATPTTLEDISAAAQAKMSLAASATTLQATLRAAQATSTLLQELVAHTRATATTYTAELAAVRATTTLTQELVANTRATATTYAAALVGIQATSTLMQELVANSRATATTYSAMLAGAQATSTLMQELVANARATATTYAAMLATATASATTLTAQLAQLSVLTASVYSLTQPKTLPVTNTYTGESRVVLINPGDVNYSKTRQGTQILDSDVRIPQGDRSGLGLGVNMSATHDTDPVRGNYVPGVSYVRNIMLDATILTATATGAAGAAITLVLPAVAGQYHVIREIEFQLFATANRTAAAAPIVITTTNLNNQVYWADAAGTTKGEFAAAHVEDSHWIRSAAAGTATTIVFPAVTDCIWNAYAQYVTKP